MKTKSLRSRLTASFATVLASLILLFCGFDIWFARTSAENTANKVLQSIIDKAKAERNVKGDATTVWGDEPDELVQQNLALLLVDQNGVVTPKTVGKVPNWPNPNSHEWRYRTVVVGNNTAVIGYWHNYITVKMVR